MERDYAAVYRGLYERHWWWRAREAMLVAELRRLRPSAPEGFGDILDIGCGDALFFDRLREFGTPQGVESDATLVTEEARRTTNIHIGPLETFHPSTRFGLIVMADVLEHVQDDAAFLRRALDLLREDGILVATTPALPLLWSAHDDANHHYRRYTRRTLRATATAAGAEIATLQDWFRWPLLPRLFARVLPLRAGTLTRIPSSPVNAMLEWVSLLDYRLRRVPLGPGTSLFAVMRRRRDSNLRSPG